MIILDWSTSFRKFVHCAMVLVVAGGDYSLISHPTIKKEWQGAQGVCAMYSIYHTMHRGGSAISSENRANVL